MTQTTAVCDLAVLVLGVLSHKPVSSDSVIKSCLGWRQECDSLCSILVCLPGRQLHVLTKLHCSLEWCWVLLLSSQAERREANMAQAPPDPSSVEAADPEESSPNMIVYRKVRIWTRGKNPFSLSLAYKRMPRPFWSQRCIWLLGCTAERPSGK